MSEQDPDHAWTQEGAVAGSRAASVRPDRRSGATAGARIWWVVSRLIMLAVTVAVLRLVAGTTDPTLLTALLVVPTAIVAVALVIGLEHLSRLGRRVVLGRTER